MKKSILLLLLSLSTLTFSQKNKVPNLGKTTADELKMALYSKDSTAVAVVLYESANLYLDPAFDYKTRTDFYFRIKILDKRGFDHANISIDTYDKKQVIDVKGITYNLSESGSIQRTSLEKENIFETDHPNKWKSTKFTMPNIKEGSVIEYTYSTISPYLTIDDWYFQSDIPKIKSEYDAAILGNYQYNTRIVGFLKLDKDNPTVDKNCVYIEGYGQGACLKYSYGMYDIPAFKEEDYMLSKKNYISRLSFDLKKYTSPRGIVENYTTSWKEADKKLKSIFFNNQTSKKGFFRKNLPEDVLSETNTLSKAKKIYNFIKDHYTWNGRYWSSEDESVKEAFSTETGSAGEINLSLYNSLHAADIDASLVILSTRNHGIPTKLYPIIFDFNYVIVKVVVDGNAYYLDATDKFLPFGQVPERCLNGEAREINFNEESNWITLSPKYKSSKNTTIRLSLEDDGVFKGNIKIDKNGYYASNSRENINLISEEKRLENFENNHLNTEVENYSVSNLLDLENTLSEVYKVSIDPDEDLANKVRINPFTYNDFTTNPFKLKERNYPVDYGYPRSNNFYISLEFPSNYKVIQQPKDLALSLPNGGGRCIIKSTVKDNIINVYVRFSITKKSFHPQEYFALKEFYKKIIEAEKSYIILEKN